jgi:hypothetical protein
MLDTDNLISEHQTYVSEIYRPSIIKDKIPHYQSVIKFLPFHEDPKLLWVEKQEVFLTNPDTNDKKSVDCPSTVKEKSVLQDAFFALYNSNVASEKELSKAFKRRATYYSIIQIIQDKHHPELEGKIMIYQFGTKIYEKLRETIKPSNDMVDSHQPFDIIKGKLFALDIGMVAGFPNYDRSQFMDKTLPGLQIDGKNVMFADDPERVKEYYVKNSPDLSKYSYKAWDDDTKSFVGQVITATLDSSVMLDVLVKKYPDVFSNTQQSNNYNSNMKVPAPQGSAKAKASPKKKEKIEEDDDVLMDFLNGGGDEDEKTNITTQSTTEDDDVIGDDFFDI